MGSVLTMKSQETLPISDLDDIFSTVEPVVDIHMTRTVVGYLDEERVSRIKKVVDKTQSGEASHHHYDVDLVVPTRFPEIRIVLSALWKVTPLQAAGRVVLAESRGEEIFAIFNPRKQEIKTLEEIFEWYDNNPEEKQKPNVTPDVTPNIYTVTGMQELIKYGNFKGVNPDA